MSRNKVVVEEGVVRVITVGIQGPPGLQGAQGEPGPADSGWAGFPRSWSPKVDRCRRRTGCLAEGSGEHHRQQRPLGRTFLLKC
jgi:hypothetical protein